MRRCHYLNWRYLGRSAPWASAALCLILFIAVAMGR